MANDIGFDIGNGSDKTQIDLLNGLAEGLACGIQSKFDYNMQLCYIQKGLSAEAIRLIRELYEFVKE